MSCGTMFISARLIIEIVTEAKATPAGLICTSMTGIVFLILDRSTAKS
jgi:hypothetical protein